MVTTKSNDTFNIGGAFLAKGDSTLNLGGMAKAIGEEGAIINLGWLVTADGDSTVEGNAGVIASAKGENTSNTGISGAGINGDFNIGVSGEAVGEGIGVKGLATLNYSLTATDVVGVSGGTEVSTGTSTTNAYAFKTDFLNAGGSITNGYGIYVGDVLGTNDYGVYQVNSGDVNYFNGDVGIATTSPSEKLDVNGNGRFRAVGSGTYANDLNITSNGTLTTSSSDARLKDDIQPFNSTLEKVLKLEGVSYKWKDAPENSKRDIGFIAQEVEQVFPEVVFTNQVDGYIGINYSRFPAILVEAIKEQQKNIERLEALINQICEEGCNKTGKGTGMEQEQINRHQLSIFPNPATQTVNVNYSVSGGKSITLEFLDLSGKMQNSIKTEINSGNQTFDVSRLPAGSYVITLRVDGSVVQSQTVTVTR